MRRVVTGHSLSGQAIVVSDAPLGFTQPRTGQEVGVVWANDRVPADNGAEATVSPGSRVPGGAAFRVVRYSPGCTGRMHATQTLDYGVVISGSIVMVLDDQAEVELHAGDLLVQRGTIHQWVNRGAEPCTIAFVLIDATLAQSCSVP